MKSVKLLTNKYLTKLLQIEFSDNLECVNTKFENLEVVNIEILNASYANQFYIGTKIEVMTKLDIKFKEDIVGSLSFDIYLSMDEDYIEELDISIKRLIEEFTSNNINSLFENKITEEKYFDLFNGLAGVSYTYDELIKINKLFIIKDYEALDELLKSFNEHYKLPKLSSSSYCDNKRLFLRKLNMIKCIANRINQEQWDLIDLNFAY